MDFTQKYGIDVESKKWQRSLLKTKRRNVQDKRGGATDSGPFYLRMCIQRQMNIGMTTRALCMQCSRSARFMSGSRVIVRDVMETHVIMKTEYAR